MNVSPKPKRVRSPLPFWMKIPLRILFLLCVGILFLILTQSIQVFPGALRALGTPSTERPPELLPEGVESIRITTQDEETLEAWRLEVPSASRVAVIFHGNGGDVANFFAYQKYFNSIGVSSYGFDYRGFGRSTGWPSERGLKFDADAVIAYVMKREGVSAEQLILVGISIGTGPAAYAAEKFRPDVLLLFSPFESLTRIVEQMPFLGYLSTFLFYEFPVAQRVSGLEQTCLIVAHGKRDNIIPFLHGKTVFESYRNPAKGSFLESPEASHNDILFKVANEIAPALARCWRSDT